LHWGDIEHIVVTLASGYTTIKEITYAFHKWSKTYTADGTQDGKISSNVTFEGDHPLVFTGNGSHASYSTAGDQYYYTAFDRSGTGYKAWAKFIDYPGSTTAGYRWTGYARLLKLNGNPTSDITPTEKILAFEFYGALGAQIEDPKVNKYVSELNKIKDIAGKLHLTKLKKDIDNATSFMTGFYDEGAVASLATVRTYW